MLKRAFSRFIRELPIGDLAQLGVILAFRAFSCLTVWALFLSLWCGKMGL
jgi:hypothetical protein